MAGYTESGTDHTTIDISEVRQTCKQCIFRVPNVLRKQKIDAYTPYVVSIGPFHHRGEGGKDEPKEGSHKEFQLMERVKKRYLNEILSWMDNTLEELTAKVTEFSDQNNGGTTGFEERARELYAEPLDHISSQDFMEMMIADGCFLIQLFRKCDDPKLRAFDDPVFNMDCMFQFIFHDILLLENQLPWFVIHSLYNLTVEKIYAGYESLSVLILQAFMIVPSLKRSCSIYTKYLRKMKCHSDADVLHILDLIRASMVIPLRTIEERARIAAVREVHPTQIRGNRNINEVIRTDMFDPDVHQMHGATALSNTGIKFQPVIRETMLDIQFNHGDGRVFSSAVLMIPQLNVAISSETLFRNLIAIEQCYHGYSNEITSYAIFMDNLISSKEDLELLCKEKVIGNWLTNEEGLKFFNNLFKDITYNKFYYAPLCKQVNIQYRLKQNQLIGENTRRQLSYFSNPWNVFYVVVGIFLLQIVPTILQTTYTLKSYYSPSPQQ